MKIVRMIIYFFIFALLSQLLLLILSREDYYDIPERKYHWIKKQIFNTTDNYSLVAIGTSQTNLGIIPKYIKQTSGLKNKIVNFGVNTPGRDLHYVLIDDILKRHKVDNLLIEIDRNEMIESHPWFKYMAPNKMFFSKGMIYPILRDVANLETSFLNISLHLLLRPMLLFLKSLFFEPGNIDTFEKNNGWYYKDPPKHIQDMFWSEFKDIPVKVQNYQPTFRDKIFKKCLPFGRIYYIKKIALLAQENNINMFFVFIPYRNEEMPDPYFIKQISQFGEVLIADMEELYKYHYWRDNEHFNSVGAKKFSLWIGKQIKMANDSHIIDK